MRFLLLCVAGLALACAAAAPPSASLATLTKKPLPNIVYIMTDDQGIYIETMARTASDTGRRGEREWNCALWPSL